ncbi:MAG TPA: hypothetical protein VK132_06355 [Gemmatimonadales bacterium]|nr:hypothetical protein [Gemmatimonadales bacterium]
MNGLLGGWILGRAGLDVSPCAIIRRVLERLFHLRERRTTVAAELRGGAVTFATMSYVIFVQPAVLSQAAGMDFGAVMTATCVSAALGIVFLSGVLFLGLTLLRVREMILDAVPASLKAAIAAGIGIFIAFIGLTQAGTVSSYIESASGVAEGARTGLANMLTAALFLAALFFAPVVAMVGGGVSVAGTYYYPITAPVVILVGSLMMAEARRIPWPDPTEAIPAFATLTLIPFTFNIAHGVAGGIIFYVVVKAGAGRRREVSWLMWVLAAVLVAAYALLPRLRH